MSFEETKFSDNLIKELLSTSIKKVPGVKKFTILDQICDFQNHIYFIEIYISDEIINLISVAIEVKNIAYYELTNQIKNHDVVVNVLIG
ncbi:hypothetical protein [Ureaplasma canigenitalium]|uniref:hypothetical protein n=1 Tax=Ureaplasma canigenitalium TaxID=42092 RepID=UPI0004E0BB76|nr:hypothetical protein [Ureaplasma canigenitalium]